MKFINRTLFICLLLPLCIHAEEKFVSATLINLPAAPASIFAGITYPNVALRITNITNLPFTLNGIYTTTYPSGFNVLNGPEGNCENTLLAAGASCTVTANFTPTTVGTNIWSFKTVIYNEKDNITYTATLPVHAKPAGIVGGVVTQELPAATAQGENYSVSFSFTNTDPQYAATGITLTHQYADFKEDKNTCGSTLAKNGGACEIEGTFTPESTGTKTISYTLTDNEKDNVTVATQTHTTQVSIIAKVAQSLPNNTAQGVTYPVIFTFQNTSALHDAIGLQLTKSIPTGFTITEDTCTNGGAKTTLAANSGCQIDATFTPVDIGAADIKLTLSYDGGGAPAVAQTTSTVSHLAIIGTVTEGLHDDTTRGVQYPVVFTFTNTNPNVMATDLKLTYPDNPQGFVVTQDTCTEKGTKTTLAANTPCQIDGTYTPPDDGPATISANLSYAGSGKPATVSTHTVSTEVTVEGKVSVALPENSAKGATYPVVFTFTNKSDKAATEVKADLSLLPVEFKLGTNGCTDITLQPKIACEVSGNYTSEVNGPVTLSISLSYTQGDTVHLATNTNVSALVLIAPSY